MSVRSLFFEIARLLFVMYLVPHTRVSRHFSLVSLYILVGGGVGVDAVMVLPQTEIEQER